MTPPYPLILNDGGRCDSKRPGQFADCSVRTLAIVSGLPYDTVYDVLAKAGRKACMGFGSDEWLRRGKGKALGIRARAVSVRGLTANTFALKHSRGTFMLETENHTWAAINGVHHDMIRVTKPLAGAWRIL